MIGSARLIRSGNSTLPTLTIEYQENGVVLAGTEQTWFITGSSRGLGPIPFTYGLGLVLRRWSSVQSSLSQHVRSTLATVSGGAWVPTGWPPGFFVCFAALYAVKEAKNILSPQKTGQIGSTGLF